MSKRTRAQLESVYRELLVVDSKFNKTKCPICRGRGLARGGFVSPSASPHQVGKCFYCGGSGITRTPK